MSGFSSHLVEGMDCILTHSKALRLASRLSPSAPLPVGLGAKEGLAVRSLKRWQATPVKMMGMSWHVSGVKTGDPL